MDSEKWKNKYRNGPSRPAWNFSSRQRRKHIEGVAVYRDQLEEAGVYPFVRYFWGPRPDDDEIRRCAPLLMPDGSKPKSLNDFFKAAYGGVSRIEALAYESPLMRMLPRSTQFAGRTYSDPVDISGMVKASRKP